MNFRKTKEIFILIKLLFNIHIYIIKTYKMQVYKIKKIINMYKSKKEEVF